MHYEICAVPAERRVEEQDLLRVLPSLRPRLDRAVFRTVDKLSCVRIGSVRYSVPTRLVHGAGDHAPSPFARSIRDPTYAASDVARQLPP